MFSDRPFIEVNREERSFCASFYHALIASKTYRTRIFELLEVKTGTSLDCEKFQLFLEPAILRDYWRDLGNPRTYHEDTRRARRSALEALLRACTVSENAIDASGVFWSSGEPNKGKLHSPGNWRIKSIMALPLTRNQQESLVSLHWVFKAQPDILLLSNGAALFCEAKLESRVTSKMVFGFKYEQRKIQKQLALMLYQYVPAFKDLRIVDIEINLGDAPRRSMCGLDTIMTGVSWRDLCEDLALADLDDFTKSMLGQLMRYYS